MIYCVQSVITLTSPSLCLSRSCFLGYFPRPVSSHIRSWARPDLHARLRYDSFSFFSFQASYFSTIASCTRIAFVFVSRYELSSPQPVYGDMAQGSRRGLKLRKIILQPLFLVSRAFMLHGSDSLDSVWVESVEFPCPVWRSCKPFYLFFLSLFHVTPSHLEQPDNASLKNPHKWNEIVGKMANWTFREKGDEENWGKIWATRMVLNSGSSSVGLSDAWTAQSSW